MFFASSYLIHSWYMWLWVIRLTHHIPALKTIKMMTRIQLFSYECSCDSRNTVVDFSFMRTLSFKIDRIVFLPRCIG